MRKRLLPIRSGCPAYASSAVRITPSRTGKENRLNREKRARRGEEGRKSSLFLPSSSLAPFAPSRFSPVRVERRIDGSEHRVGHTGDIRGGDMVRDSALLRGVGDGCRSHSVERRGVASDVVEPRNCLAGSGGACQYRLHHGHGERREGSRRTSLCRRDRAARGRAGSAARPAITRCWLHAGRFDHDVAPDAQPARPFP